MHSISQQIDFTSWPNMNSVEKKNPSKPLLVSLWCFYFGVDKLVFQEYDPRKQAGPTVYLSFYPQYAFSTLSAVRVCFIVRHSLIGHAFNSIYYLIKDCKHCRNNLCKRRVRINVSRNNGESCSTTVFICV